MTISKQDFASGQPVAYKSPRGRVVIWFDPRQGIGIKLGKEVSWSDVFTEKSAMQLYSNMNLGEVQVPAKEEDLSIPKELKRTLPKDWEQRRQKIIDEHRNPTLRTASGQSTRDFTQPKGMSDEEWKKLKAKKQADRDEKKRARFAELKANKPEKVPARKGMVDVATIAQELNSTPQDCRAILRGKIAKPPHGWAWLPGKELEEIRALLRKALAPESVGKSDSKTVKRPAAGGKAVKK